MTTSGKPGSGKRGSVRVEPVGAEPAEQRPLSDVVRVGVGWGLLIGLLLPLALAVMAIIDDTGPGGGGSSFGNGRPPRRRPRRRLQYSVTAVTALVVDGLVLAAVLVMLSRAG